MLIIENSGMIDLENIDSTTDMGKINSNLKESINERSKNIDSYKRLINEDLTDSEFFELLKKLYSIELNESDYESIASKVVGGSVKKTIKSNIVREFKCKNPRSNSYSSDYKYVDFVVLSADGLDLNETHRYRKEEITQLVREKKISIIEMVKGSEPEYVSEKSILTPLSYFELSTVDSIKPNAITESNPNYDVVCSNVREKISKERLSADMQKYIDGVKTSLTEIREFSSHARDVLYEKTFMFSNMTNICDEGLKLEKKI